MIITYQQHNNAVTPALQISSEIRLYTRKYIVFPVHLRQISPCNPVGAEAVNTVATDYLWHSHPHHHLHVHTLVKKQ